jgi:hypothetical protein
MLIDAPNRFLTALNNYSIDNANNGIDDNVHKRSSGYLQSTMISTATVPHHSPTGYTSTAFTDVCRVCRAGSNWRRRSHGHAEQYMEKEFAEETLSYQVGRRQRPRRQLGKYVEL